MGSDVDSHFGVKSLHIAMNFDPAANLRLEARMNGCEFDYLDTNFHDIRMFF